jgi:lysophospholipase L1-like esterase
VNPNLSITELSERTDVIDSKFRGKTIAVWGTSVESNAPSSDPDSPSSLDDSWPALLGQMVHANILNYGSSGTTLAVNTVQTDAASAAVNRILTQDTSASADIILISEGLNDFKLYTPLGDPTNKTIPEDSTALDAYIATFYGALRVMLTRAETKYPGKPIYWIMPQKRSDESTNYGGGAYSSYRKAIVDVCNEFGVQIIDWYNMIPNLAGTPGYSQYMLNETHFNHAGNTLVANIVRKALIGSLPDAKVKEYELPAIPQTNGTYKLQVVITGGIPAFSWVAA